MIFSLKWRALPFATAAMLALSLPVYATDPGQTQQVAATTPGAITINNFTFGPSTITVAAGTKVTWTNKDEEPHTVTSADGGQMFKSPALDTDDKFSFTFSQAGTYKYFCSIHPHMTGLIIVK